MTIEMKVTWTARFEYLASSRGTAPDDDDDRWARRYFQYSDEETMRSELHARRLAGWIRNVEIARVITLTEPKPGYHWRQRPEPEPVYKAGDPCPTCGAAMVQMQGGVECLSDHK